MSVIQQLEGEELLDKIKQMSLVEFKNVLSEIKPSSEINLYNKLVELQKNIYWKLQDLDKMLSVSEATLKFLKNHPDSTPKLNSAILYNTASFTCPWWSDSLDISTEQADQGFESAKQLVKLREENNFETIKQAGALWILAGHYLYTAKDANLALKFYERTEELARSVPDEKLSSLLISNSIEGTGRVEILLNRNLKLGKNKIDEAILLYKQNEDDYSEGEAKIFIETNLVN